jgi:ATP-dependent helicase STH1/SNF2
MTIASVTSTDKPHGAPSAGNIESTNSVPAASRTVSVTPNQMTILRAQIQALQYIARNQVIPPHVQHVIYTPADTDRNLHEEFGVQRTSAERLTGDPSATTKGTDTTDSGLVIPNGVLLEKDTSSTIYPYNAFTSAESELVDAIRGGRAHKVIIPNLMPTGLDPYQIIAERQRFVDARIEHRIQELSNLPSTMTDDTIDRVIITNADDPEHPPMSSAKLRALVELKALRLREKQRALRSSVVARLQETSSLSLDRKVFRRLRKPTLKDARSIESLERRQREDREKRAKQKHLDYLQGICKHGEDLITEGRSRQARAARLGKTVLKFHIDTEKEEQKRVERISRERLKALKADDEEAYMKLIDTAKDTRITHLLRQTDSYLDSLAQAVIAQQGAQQGDMQRKSGHTATDETTFGATRMDDDDEGDKKKDKIDYYSVAHRFVEKIAVQPRLLVGGTLKEYQLKGLQWMVSLYNNHLNGILADEMVSQLPASCLIPKLTPYPF